MEIIGKLADQTSATATKLTIALPGNSVLPSAATGLTGVPLSRLDGIFVETVTSGAVQLTQGLTIYGANGTADPTVTLAVFSPPAAALQNVGYSYGRSVGASTNMVATSFFAASGFLCDRMTFEATPGAATTVRIIVYGVRFV